MADPQIIHDGIGWIIGGTSGGGVLLGMAGQRAYNHFFGGAVDPGNREFPNKVIEEVRRHHEKEIEILGEINGSIRELTAYMKGVHGR